YEGIMDSNLGIRDPTSVVLPAYFQGLKSKQWMMLDSGSTNVMITAPLAKKLGLKEIEGAAYAGLGTEKVRRTAWVLIPSLKMGSLTIQNVPAIIISKKSDFWDRISGIIPLSLFNRFAVEYDRRHGNLTLYPSGTDPAKIMGQGTFTVPSLWFNDRPYIQADINGHAKRYCLLDTGSTDLYLALEHADELGLSMKTAKYNRQVVTGMAGSAAANVAEQVVIKMGTGEFQMPTVQVMKLDEDNNFIDCYGLFGRQLLDLFEIVFDYRKNVVAFRGYDKH
ncbi:MAG: retroviral-like aspartic protease family protein, partial [Acidobacteriota bacterium]